MSRVDVVIDFSLTNMRVTHIGGNHVNKRGGY